PSGQYATVPILLVCSCNRRSSCPVATSQIRAVPSLLAVRILLPSWLKANDTTSRSCLKRTPNGCPEATFHNLAAPSSPPVRSVFPSGAKTAARTVPISLGDSKRSWLVKAFHNRALVPTVRTVALSGLNAIWWTHSLCSQGGARGLPVFVSQSRPWPTLLRRGWLLVRMLLPSGLKQAANTMGYRCSRTGPTWRQSPFSQSRACLSSLPVKIVSPSGWNATACTPY